MEIIGDFVLICVISNCRCGVLLVLLVVAVVIV
jgi:hypothetical protein